MSDEGGQLHEAFTSSATGCGDATCPTSQVQTSQRGTVAIWVVAIVKGPIHDSDLQSQPQFPTAISTKFPVYGLQQQQPPPQLACRCCGCC